MWRSRATVNRVPRHSHKYTNVQSKVRDYPTVIENRSSLKHPLPVAKRKLNRISIADPAWMGNDAIPSKSRTTTSSRKEAKRKNNGSLSPSHCPTTRRKLTNNSSTMNKANFILKSLYVVTTFHCLFMLPWLLIFPATFRVGGYYYSSESHNAQVYQIIEDTAPHYIPRTLFSKFAGHVAVQFTHILPSAIWAGAIPIQFHPSIRDNYRRFHKWVGRGLFVVVPFDDGWLRHYSASKSYNL